MNLNATILVQMVHFLIAYAVMYHVFIKYALQLLKRQRDQERVLAQSAAFLKEKETEAEQELRRIQLHLQKRLMETIPQEVAVQKTTLVETLVDKPVHSKEVINNLAQEISTKLEKDILS